MQITAPKIDERTFEDIVNKAKSIAPFYTPEWNASAEKEAGSALLKLFAYMLEMVITRINKVPDKNFVDFLNILDMKLLPARSARVPVTFQLAEGTTENVLVPAGTQVSAPATEKLEEQIFETERNMLATYAKLIQVYSTNPSNDEIYNHTTPCLDKTPFEIFTGVNLQEHILYLAHNDLFNIKSAVTFEIEFVLGSEGDGVDKDDVIWEYWNGENWVGINVKEDKTKDDVEKTLKKSGIIILEKLCTGEISEMEIEKVKSRWIRCRLISPIIPSKSNNLPMIDTIHVRTQPERTVFPDLAFFSDVPQNLVGVAFAEVSTNMLPIELDDDLVLEDSLTAGITQATLNSTMELESGDWLRFWIEDEEDNYEERVITKENDKVISWDVGLINSYSTDAKITLHTAIRKNVLNPWVRVESLEGFVEGGKTYLYHAGESETSSVLDIDVKGKRLRLNTRGFSHAYKEEDNIVLQSEDEALEIYPFGTEPRLFSTFYIASKEVFSKRDALINLNLSILREQTDEEINPRLSWEYWNGSGWQLIKILTNTIDEFKEDKDAEITFKCPNNIATTEVFGNENFWIRVRFIAGNYGTIKYDFDNNEILNKLKPPRIRRLVLSYLPEFEELQYCLTFNNLNYINYTDTSKFRGQLFKPFQTLDHKHQILHLGFDNPLVSGPINIFFSLFEQLIPEATKPKIEWTYWNGLRWASLNNVDNTESLTRSDTLSLIGAGDFVKKNQFGHELFWLRGSLIEGKFESDLEMKGIYPNTTWAFQVSRIDDEILGSSDGTPDQESSFLRFPVISQEIWIKESNLPSEKDRSIIIKQEGETAIDEIKDDEGRITGAWIRWHEVDSFHDSSLNSRHYTLDPAMGKVIFGSGEQGMIPPKGINNIKSTYRFGGGIAGNIDALEINSLKSAVPHIKSVINYEAADGGSDTEGVEDILIRGPQMLKHRDRAVTEEDYEWLTRQASQYVARVKCLPHTNNLGQFETGWVTVIIVPESKDAKPYPSPQLITRVERYLGERCVNTVFAPQHLHVTGPKYVVLQVTAVIVPVSIDVVATVGQEVLNKLNTFFHPLTGGREKSGWEFGRKVCISDVHALIEDIEEVDYVKSMVLISDRKICGEKVEIDKNSLVCSGEHEIRVILEDR